jgi:hypothetical protein
MKEKSMENLETLEKEEMEDTTSNVELPAGIKTETVLQYLGEISGALASIANDINQTIVNIMTAGTEQLEGEQNDDED